jgi:RNA polymerase sigma-70 factor (ECF subfamily)
VVDGDPVAYVRRLQQDGEGDIAVTGGIETVRSLFLAGVVDALMLTVHPVATDQGRRLFDETVPLTRLTLLDGTTTRAGNALLTYGLRR